MSSLRLLTILASLFLSLPTLAQTRFVSTTGTNADPATATSWSLATADLQGAINSLSTTGGEVWVTQGVYKPGGNTNLDRNLSFTTQPNVAIYGGFAGNEGLLTSRPPINLGSPSSTTLSGDINNDAAPAGNSYHVVRFGVFDSNTQLDGFVITGGNADGGGNNNLGGGIWVGNEVNSQSITSPAIRNCLIVNNSATEGGGLYVGSNQSNSPVIRNCFFTGNTAQNGGAVNNKPTAIFTITSPDYINCLFWNNRATQSGGGMWTEGRGPFGPCEVDLTNCTFSNNRADNGTGQEITIFGTDVILNLNSTIVWNALSSPMANFQNPNAINPNVINATNALFSANISNTLYTGSNNVVSVASPFFESNGYLLSPCSLAINAGNFSHGFTASPTDLAGNPRRYTSGGTLTTVDIGALEFQGDRQNSAGLFITTPPVSRTNCIGGTITATVSVSGAGPFTYQLYRAADNTVVATSGSTSQTTTTLSYVTTQLSDFGTYYVVVASACNSVSSVFETTYTNIEPTRLYVNVNATGANTGLTWPDAFTSLQSAIDYNGCTNSVTEVWVANGTYRPTSATGLAARQASFTLRNNLTILGGFAGSGPNPDSRTTPTPGVLGGSILSGDIGIPNDLSDNSYHVVVNGPGIDNTAILDGFNITGGNSNTFAVANADRGGGMVNRGGASPQIRNCQFIQNWGFYAGGMYNEGVNTSPILTNCVFHSNTANSWGGGVYNLNPTGSGTMQPQFVNCEFRLNRAAYGGAVSSQGTTPSQQPVQTPIIQLVFSGCRFFTNTAGILGGGLHSEGAFLSLSACQYNNNQASAGGALYASYAPFVEREGRYFPNQAPGGRGGAISSNQSSFTLISTFLDGNTASRGGAIYIRNENAEQVKLISCGFNNNRADGQGGAIYQEYNTGVVNPVYLDLTNCTFHLNQAPTEGSVLYASMRNGESTVRLDNGLVWNNSPGSTFAGTSFTVTANYSLFDAGATGYTAGPGSFTTAVPPIIAASNPGSGDLRPLPCSPAINAGDNAAPDLAGIGTDLGGLTRLVSGTVDIGAHELGTVLPNFSVALTQTGAAACVGNGIVILSTITSSSPGSLIYRWFRSTAGGPVSLTPTANRLTLTNLQLSDAGDYYVEVTEANCRTVTSGLYSLSVITGPPRLYVSASATGLNTGADWPNAFTSLQTALEGCPATTEIWVAGGLYKPSATGNRSASFVLRPNLKVYGGFQGTESDPSERLPITLANPSSSTLSGDLNGNGLNGSLQVVQAPASLTTTDLLDAFVITGGNADGTNGIANGAGYISNGGSPSLTRCLFVDNQALSFGGGFYSTGGGPVLTDCWFFRNIGGSGGALASAGQGLTIINGVFDGNSSSYAGGAISNFGVGAVTLNRCLFRRNSVDATGYAGGAFNNEGGTLIATNCTFEANRAPFGGGLMNEGGATAQLTNCSFQSNSATTSDPERAGAILNNGSNTDLVNVILWGNGGVESLRTDNSGTTTARYSLFENTINPATYTGPNNLTTNTSPFASTTGTQLAVNALAIESGDPATTSAIVGTTDLGGAARFVGCRIDMGAYEFATPASLPVAFTSGPAASSVVCVGATVSVPVGVSGTTTGFQWYLNGTAITGQTSATLTLSNVTSGSAGSYSLVVAGACNSVTSSAFSLTVDNQLAAPTVTINPTSATLTCATPTVTLTASGSAATYVWTGGTTGATLPVSTSGTYSVTATGTNGCTATTNTTVVSNTAAINVSLVSSNSLNCSVTSSTLTATAMGVGSLTYTFRGGSLPGTPSSNSTVVVTAGGSYSVLVTAANGCSALQSTSVVSDTALPTVTLAPPSGTLTCAVTSLTLTATTSGTGLLWSNAATTQSITLNSGGTYSVTATGTNGCSAVSNSVVVSSTTIFSNTSTPTAGLVASGTITCAIPTVTLTASGGAGIPGATYAFSGPAGLPTGIVGTAGNTALVNAAGTYSVTVLNPGNGCFSTTDVVVSSNVGGTLAAPTLSASSSVVCAGTNVQVVATVVGSPTGMLWYRDGQSTGQTTLTLTLNGAQVGQSGSYVLVLTGACSTTSTPFILTVNPLPTVALSFPTGTSVSAGNPPVITLPNPLPAGFDFSFGVSGGTSYERVIVLDRTNGYELRAVDSTTDRFAINRAGLFTITATNGNGCRQTVQGIIANHPALPR